MSVALKSLSSHVCRSQVALKSCQGKYDVALPYPQVEQLTFQRSSEYGLLFDIQTLCSHNSRLVALERSPFRRADEALVYYTLGGCPCNYQVRRCFALYPQKYSS